MSLNLATKRQPRAPLHLCSLTLNPHRNPVASPDGNVFESSTIRQLVRRTGINPITGQPLSPDSLIPLSISTDPRTSLPRCPILFHSFNQNIKVVAIATTGNVYSYAAVHRHNIQSGTMTDLIDRTPFTSSDIILLFDPKLHVWSSELHHEHQRTLPTPERFLHHLPPPEYPQQSPRVTHRPPISPTPSISPLTDIPSVLVTHRKIDPLPHHRHLPHFSNSPIPVKEPSPLPSPPQPPDSKHSIVPAHASVSTQSLAHSQTVSCYPTSHPSPLSSKRTVSKRLEPAPILKKPRIPSIAQPATAQHPKPSAANKKVSPLTYFERKKAEEERKAVYKRIRKGRKGKGYVRVVTNIGHLNIELHCDKVPMTCDNFLGLAEAKYYDGLRWHRVIPGFIAQTGDPTNTGEGGDSLWGGYFKDEIRTSLMHDSAGVVSMANSGRDANLSQWFICLDGAPHLDGSHTVFGKVVGGLFVLQKIEVEAEMGHPLTIETIEVLVNPIRQIREQMKKQSIPQRMPSADNSVSTINSQASSVPGNKPSTSFDDQTQQSGQYASTTGTTNTPAHKEARNNVPPVAPNPVREPIHENLPPASTLLSAVDDGRKLDMEA